MTRSADVVVVGCGAAGMSAIATLAERGRRVIGVDRFEFGHRNGSSHGTERIVRVAYADEVHARMAVASLDGWRRLERVAGTRLLTQTGGIDVGEPSEIDALAKQCERVGVAVERLSSAEVTTRFPMFHDLEGLNVMYHAASTVHADHALLAMRTIAQRHGAELHLGVRVNAIEPVDDGRVVVQCADGPIAADTCVVAVGAWAGDGFVRTALGGDARLPPLRVTQEQVSFHRPVSVVGWPTFVVRQHPTVYGLPTPDGMVKIGEHHTGPLVDPEAKSDEVEQFSWDRLQGWVVQHLPTVDPEPVRSTTCLYASYPGDTFLFDRIGPVVAGLGLSGHGFKFVPEIGRLLADLAERVDNGSNPFGLDRPPLDVGASGHR